MEKPQHPAIPAQKPRRQRPTPSKSSLLASSPWMPVKYEKADVSALQALERGEASREQQQRALRWVVVSAAGTYDMPFRPGGEDGRRDTDFAIGRMFVGQQVVKLLKLNLAEIPNEDPRADPIEPKE